LIGKVGLSNPYPISTHTAGLLSHIAGQRPHLVAKDVLQLVRDLIGHGGVVLRDILPADGGGAPLQVIGGGPKVWLGHTLSTERLLEP
jgi:hypothetical protein